MQTALPCERSHETQCLDSRLTLVCSFFVSGSIDEPRQLIGIKKDPVSGYCWHRKESFHR